MGGLLSSYGRLAVPRQPALNQRDELALGLGISLNVVLRHGQAGMPGELLLVAEAPSNLGHFAGGAGNEGPASRV